MYDEKRDADIIKALRTNTVEITDLSFNEMLYKAEELKTEIDEVQSTLTDKSKELKKILDDIKKYAATQFREGDNKVSFKGKRFEFSLSLSQSTELDTEKLIQDFGESFLETYTKTKTSYRLTTNKIKEDK
jgi:hypothetical protein